MTKPPSNVTPIGARLRNAPAAPRRHSVLPEDCPITPLGVEGKKNWLLDALGQLISATPQELGAAWLPNLFTPHVSYLEKHWPRKTKIVDKKAGTVEWVINGIKAEQVRADIVQACGALGVWSPYAKVRGRGAWRGEDGDLILHCGDVLYINGQITRPCVRNGMVYPVYSARPRPAADPEPGGGTGAGHQLLTMLNTWSWHRRGLDARLLLGWVCAAILGGALHWRPACWVTGDRGTGKSTLQELIRCVLVDGEGIYSVSDTTAAGIRSAVGFDSLPVGLDELEAEEDNTRVNAVIGLARQASSGGVILRGSSDHSGANFIARFATLYSSILIPPLRAQDRSRIALLGLRPLGNARPPVLRPDELRELGQRLMRRMADRWQHLPAAMETWREALMAQGYDSRGCDQFGTLLACADLALEDEPIDSDSLAEIVGRLVDSTADERADELADWARCIEHLTTSAGPILPGKMPATVGTLMAMAAARPVIRDADTGDSRRPDPKQQADAADMLSMIGVRVMEHAPNQPAMVAVANSHKGLNGVFQGSHWQARSGASGTWKQALGRCPGAVASAAAVRFRGTQQRAVLVPLARMLGEYDAAAAAPTSADTSDAT
jgi:hypothetical protein